MKTSNIADTLHDHQFAVEVSKRYHAHRMDAIRFWAFFLEVCEVAASVGALMTLVAELSVTLAEWILAIGALFGVLGLIVRMRKRIEWHIEKKAAFAELGKLFPVNLETGTAELLHTITERRADIEKDDGKGFPCLDVLCHNEECQARGWLDKRKPLSFIQRHIGTSLIPLPYIEE